MGIVCIIQGYSKLASESSLSLRLSNWVRLSCLVYVDTYKFMMCSSKWGERRWMQSGYVQVHVLLASLGGSEKP